MTHDQIVAALRRGYQLDDARESRRGCYPIREPAPRTKARCIGDAPLAGDRVAASHRWFERCSRPRASRLFEHRVTRSVFGALVFRLALSALLAPPSSGLDILPSLGVVVIGLGRLLRDLLLAFRCAARRDRRATILAIGNLAVERPSSSDA